MSIIKEMSYGYDTKIRSDRSGYEGYEILAAEMISDATPSERDHDTNVAIPANLDVRLTEVNSQLDRYTCTVQKEEYALSIACGIVSGIIDSVYVREFDHSLENIDVKDWLEKSIREYADKKSVKITGEHLDDTTIKGAIEFLEQNFKVPQDHVTLLHDKRISPTNHHLTDLAHHPTPLGLFASILIRFAKVGVFITKDGEILFKKIDVKSNYDKTLLIAAIFTGVLNWFITLVESQAVD